MANFDIGTIRARVAGAVVPAIELAVGTGKTVTYRKLATIFEDGVVAANTVEVLVIPESFMTTKTGHGLTAEVSFGVVLRSKDEQTAWRAASGIYSVAKRAGVNTVSVDFLSPDEAEHPEYLVHARLSVET